MYNYALAKDKIPLKSINKLQSSQTYSLKMNEADPNKNVTQNCDEKLILSNTESSTSSSINPLLKDTKSSTIKTNNNWYNYSGCIEDEIIDQKWLKAINLAEKAMNNAKNSKARPWVNIPFTLNKNDPKFKISIKEFQDSASTMKSCEKTRKTRDKAKVQTFESTPNAPK